MTANPTLRFVRALRLPLALSPLLACATPEARTRAPRAEPHPIHAEGYESPSSPITVEEPESQAAPTLDLASLPQLLRHALAQRPELDAAQRELAARMADARQAGRRPNPSLGLQVEDFAGSGALSDFNGAQSTLSLAQVFEGGGKRQAREELARLGAELARQAGGLVAHDVVAQTTSAFWRALEAQGELEIARSLEETTSGFLGVVRERVLAGKVSPVEEAKYAVATASAKLDRQDAQRALALALVELEACVGGGLRVSGINGEFGRVVEPPRLEELARQLDESPRITGLTLEESRAEASIKLAESSSAVDFEVSLGVRRFEINDTSAAVLGVEIPLPVFNRGRDAVEAARARRSMASALRRTREVELKLDLERAWSRLAGAYADLRALETSVLDEAAWVSSTVDEGYREGKFELLEALDAQRTAIDLRTRHLRSVAQYHLALTEIEFLLCQSLYPR